MRRLLDPLTRFEVSPSGCWLWTGPVDSRGYGRHGAPLAHRLVYEILIGPIPNDMELDHLCRIPRCVNPSHLEPVTHAENVRRGEVGAINRARQKALTVCKRGHEFTPENTRIDRRGDRSCRECSRALHRSYYQRDIEKYRQLGRDKQRARRAHKPEKANA